mgnify:CR=1 FL=1
MFHSWLAFTKLQRQAFMEYPRLVKSFTLLSLSGRSAVFILVISVSLHYNMYKNKMKFATSTSENGKN